MVDRPPPPADDNNTKAYRRRPTWLLAGAGLLALGLLVVLVLACVLWIPRWLYPSLTDSDLKDVKTAQNDPDAAKVQELKGARLKLQNDARTTLLQGLGAVLVLIGAGVGASVTLRQVRATRDQIRETATASRNQLKLSEQGQVTDRFTKAVEQLGHEKSPVRLGALYSLEHLAQDNPEYRQTVVDVFCAYLRMPYTLPTRNKPSTKQLEHAAPPAGDGIPAAHPAPGQDPAQEELQVRAAAQRTLATHLHLRSGTNRSAAQRRRPSPQEIFWPGVSLDLTGALLVDFDFTQVSVVQVQFDEASFQGMATFAGATFQHYARFDEATFQDDARFDAATFHGMALFDEATFQRAPRFSGAIFQGVARFDGAAFRGGAALFTGAAFRDNALFDEAAFQGVARFDGAAFQGVAGFAGATFQGVARFDKAAFQATTRFDEASFQGAAWFDGATFTRKGAMGVAQAQVLHLDDSDLTRRRVWPNGFTVHPDPADPTRGTLVRAEQTVEPEPAVSPPDQTSR